MRYFIVLDMPDTTYPVSDPFYAPDGKDPFGRSSLAGWIESALDETYLGERSGPPDDVTVYTDLDDILRDRAEGLDMFQPSRLARVTQP